MPKICVETFSVALRNQLLVGGRFIAAIPSSMFLAKTKSPALKVLPIELPKKPWPVAMVTLNNRTLSSAANLFIENAREIAGLMKARRQAR
jgi:DNA-binding transcriptional LysR family regulator